jgi:altronate dehydratase
MVLHKDDDVAVLLEDGHPEDWIEASGTRVGLRVAVPRFHKVALRRITAGETVRKVGEAIGVATRLIEAGEHVHVHNLKSQRSGAPANPEPRR